MRLKGSDELKMHWCNFKISKILNFRSLKFKTCSMPTKTNHFTFSVELSLENLDINQRSYYYLLNSAFKILNSGLILKTFTHENDINKCMGYGGRG